LNSQIVAKGKVRTLLEAQADAGVDAGSDAFRDSVEEEWLDGWG
jgi:hypothetical protein